MCEVGAARDRSDSLPPYHLLCPEEVHVYPQEVQQEKDCQSPTWGVHFVVLGIKSVGGLIICFGHTHVSSGPAAGADVCLDDHHSLLEEVAHSADNRHAAVAVHHAEELAISELLGREDNHTRGHYIHRAGIDRNHSPDSLGRRTGLSEGRLHEERRSSWPGELSVAGRP